MSAFYNVKHLTLKDRVELLEKAKEVCTTWWVDELDCKKSFSRVSVEMPFKEIMKCLDMRCHFVAIHRNEHDDHFEFGFSTMYPDKPDLFLWINVETSKGLELVKDLKPLGV